MDKEQIEEQEAKNALLKERKIIVDGTEKIINPWIMDFIKTHARSTKDEIYGWLIGRESKDKNINICSAIACQHYKEQSFIGAAPDPQELQELGTNIPDGLGIMGLYHSHPTHIFHSSVDDGTLKNMAKYYPRMLSAVTNADYYEENDKNATRWFQLDEAKNQTQEISVSYKSFDWNKFRLVFAYGILEIDIDISPKGKIVQELNRVLMSKFDSLWENTRFRSFKLPRKVITKKEDTEFFHFQDPWAIDEMNLSLTKLSDDPSIFNAHKNDHYIYDLNTMGKRNNIIKILLEEVKDRDSIPLFLMNFDNDYLVEDTAETDGPKINIKTTIPIVSMNVFEDSYIKFNNFEDILEKIKSEFHDDIIKKISRAIIEVRDKELFFHTAHPVFLHYPGVPYKIDILLHNIKNLKKRVNKGLKNVKNYEGLSENSFYNIDQIFDIESKSLNSIANRASILSKINMNDNQALLILDKIHELYQIRGQDELKKLIKSQVK